MKTKRWPWSPTMHEWQEGSDVAKEAPTGKRTDRRLQTSASELSDNLTKSSHDYIVTQIHLNEVWRLITNMNAEGDPARNVSSTTVLARECVVSTATVGVILHENQRLDVRLKTLAVNGGRPKFSVSGLGRRGRRAPFELRLPKVDEDTGKRFIPAWRSDVQLPYIEEPFALPKPTTGSERHLREGAEKSHFWL